MEIAAEQHPMAIDEDDQNPIVDSQRIRQINGALRILVLRMTLSAHRIRLRIKSEGMPRRNMQEDEANKLTNHQRTHPYNYGYSASRFCCRAPVRCPITAPDPFAPARA